MRPSSSPSAAERRQHIALGGSQGLSSTSDDKAAERRQSGLGPPTAAALLLLILAVVSTTCAADDIRSITIEMPAQHDRTILSGADDAWQLVITGTASDRQFDATKRASFSVSPDGIIDVSRAGLVTPLKDGDATLDVRVDRQTTQLKVTVKDVDQPRTLNFVTDVAPLFSRFDCNSGGCHGKKGGQEGFELALLGFEPELDYDRLVKESDGYRIDLENPADSYLLQKATRAEPHSGGERFKKDSAPYRLLHRWVAQGAPRGHEDDAVVERIEVLPRERVLHAGEQQRLLVVAHMSDGSIRDVGRYSRFESNEKAIVHVDEAGIAAGGDQPGVGAVMVRYQAHVGVFRAIVPTGESLKKDALPEPQNFVDELVFRQLERLGIPPSATCDDATFIRRATIDIAGRLPTVEEATQFVADNDATKYDKLVDRLLTSDGYADYFANKWATLLHNRRNSERDNREPTTAFHTWIRDAIAQNKSFDEVVRGVLTATGEEVKTPPVIWYRVANEPSTQLEDVAQLFLGQRIQCARCHHHPFEKWSEDDYYGLAAFFSRLEIEDRPKGKKEKKKPPMKVSFKSGRAEAKHPKTGVSLKPTPLGETPLDVNEKTDPREKLVEWITGKSNPFFARVVANRYWKHFLGRGLVEPEDDMRVTNPPTNSELLDALAQHFIDSGFDARKLIRVICTSKTYRLSSDATPANVADRQNYSRFMPRRLTAEVFSDAIDTVTLMKTKYAGVGSDVRAVQYPDNQSGSYMLNIFGKPAGLSVCECERTTSATLSQTLHLINSSYMIEKVTGERTKQLARDKRPHEERLRDLFLSALSREPTELEMTQILDFFRKEGVITSDESEAASLPVQKTKPEERPKEPAKNVTVVSISASGHQNANTPQRVFDNDPKSRWASNGVGEWLQFVLSDRLSLSELRIGFDKGQRTYRFDIEHSSDGKRWAKHSSFASNGKGNDVQTFKFKELTSRHFRIVSQGNSDNNWANIHTVEIPGISVDSKNIPVKPAVNDSDRSKNELSARESDATFRAYADVVWVVLNTKEFQFTH